MLFGDRAEDGETDGVIATNTDAANAGLEKGSDPLLDAEKRVLDGEWVHRQIAKISDTIFCKRIQLQDGVPRADDCGLDADVAWPKARSRAIGGAAVKGDADDGDLKLLGLCDVREAHEGGYAREASILQSVERLGMWQTEAAGLRGDFGHGEAS